MKLKYSNLDFTPSSINEQDYTLRAVFSTADVDRHGEIVDQKSWILDDFEKNPVLLFGHDHSQPPVGKIIDLMYNQKGDLEGTVKFAAKEYPFANVIWNLYKGGFMRAFSVGFSAGKADVVNGTIVLKENKLFEISTVSVPANQMALAKSKGIDVEALEEVLKGGPGSGGARDGAGRPAGSGSNITDTKEGKDILSTIDNDGAEAFEVTEFSTDKETKAEYKKLTDKYGDGIDGEDGDGLRTTSWVVKDSVTTDSGKYNRTVHTLNHGDSDNGGYHAQYAVNVSSDGKIETELSRINGKSIVHAKDCPCQNKQPVLPTETISEEQIVIPDAIEGTTETIVEPIADEEAAIAKSFNDVVEYVKAGRVLSAANRSGLLAAVDAITSVLEADKPSEDKSIEEVAETIEIKEAPIAAPTPVIRENAMSARNINKTIRALLKQKRSK